MLPVISVVIPNFNHAQFLNQRIDSILNQTYQNFEIIILDDCSTDNSRDVIETYRDNKKVKHIIYNTVNSGSPFIQWRKGIDLAQHDYIWIAESDDYSHPAFLEKTVAQLTNNVETVLCYSNSNVVTNGSVMADAEPSLYYNKLFGTTRWSANFVNDGMDELKNYMGGFCTIINASSCVFSKATFPYQNTSINQYKYCGDWLVWIEIFTKGNIAFINEPLNYFRIHPKSTVNEFEKITKARELYNCLTRAKQLTNGKSIIPNETLNNFLHIWAHNSIYFFIKNFRVDLFIMHARLDKNFTAKIYRSVKNYFHLKIAKN